MLPVALDGISPDLDSLEVYNNLMEKYNNHKDSMSKKDIINMFENEGFIVKFDANGNIDVSANQNRIKPFLITSAYTTSAAKSLLEDNKDIVKGGLRQLDKHETNALKKIEDLGWTIHRPGKPIDTKPSAGWFGGKKRYKGTIIIPLLPEADLKADEILGVGAKQEYYSRQQIMAQNQNSSNQPFINTDISLFE